MNNIFDSQKTYKLLIHISVWSFLLCMPLLLSIHNNSKFIHIIQHWWIPTMLYFIIFYLNYLVLIDKFFFSKKKIWFFIINLVILFAMAYFNQYIKPTLFNKMWHPRRHMFFLYMDMLTMMLPLVMAITFKVYERWQKIERKHQESANAQLQTELKHLEYQIQPHFFFNSLNNIYSLVDISPERAKETIHNLSKLMRYLLYETNNSLVTLEGEINFMTKYIELMKLRSSKNTVVSYTFPENTNSIMVAPLIFISLIENSFKHGIKLQGTSELNFSMRIDDSKIIFETSNPYFEKNNSGDLSGGSSIGLENIRKRLSLLYPNRSLFYTKIENEQYLTYLEIDTKPNK